MDAPLAYESQPLLNLLNTGFREVTFIPARSNMFDEQETVPESDSTSKRERDVSVDQVVAPKFKYVKTASVEFDEMPSQGTIALDLFQRRVTELTDERRTGQLSVGAMVERLSRLSKNFVEPDHSGREILIRVRPGLFYQLRITREEHCSNCFPAEQGKLSNYIEVHELDTSKDCTNFKKLPQLVSMRADDEGTGEWMWINAGSQTRGSESKIMAEAMSRCLGLGKVFLADFAQVPAAGLPGEMLRLSLLRQLIYGAEEGSFYASEGFRRVHPHGSLVSRIEIQDGEYLAINPHFAVHDECVNTLRNLQVRDIYNTLLKGDAGRKKRFKAIYDSHQSRWQGSPVGKSSRRMYELLSACKETASHEDLAFLCLRVVQLGVHANEGTKTHAAQVKVMEAWEALYFDVVYCASFL